MLEKNTISYFESFFDWHARITRQDFLKKFILIQVVSFVVFSFFAVPSALNEILLLLLGLVSLYVNLCVIYQYITNSLKSNRILACYIVWVFSFMVTAAAFSWLVHQVFKFENQSFGYFIVIMLFASFRPIISILTAYFLSYQKVLSRIQGIVEKVNLK